MILRGMSRASTGARMGNNEQQWATMGQQLDNNGQQWVTMGQQWTTMCNNGQQSFVMLFLYYKKKKKSKECSFYFVLDATFHLKANAKTQKKLECIINI